MDKPATHEDTTVREDPDKGVVLVYGPFAGVAVVPKEGVRGPDPLSAGQGEVGGGVVFRGELKPRVQPRLPGGGGGEHSRSLLARANKVEANIFSHKISYSKYDHHMCGNSFLQRVP